MKILNMLLVIFFTYVINANATSPQIKPEEVILRSNGTKTPYGTLTPYFPTITRHPSGEIFMSYRLSESHTGENLAHRNYFKRSIDNGKTWSESIELKVSDYIAYGLLSSGMITALSNGDLVYTFITYKPDFENYRLAPNNVQPHVIDTYFTKSKDGGKTWSEPVIIPTIEKACNFYSGQIIELDNGDLLLPAYCPDKDTTHSFDAPGFWRDSISTVIRSSDQGETWEDESIVTTTGDVDGYNEMSIVNAGDGHIYAIARENGKIFRSIDNGHTWNLFDDTNQKMHAPHFLKIDKDKFFLTWCALADLPPKDPYYGNRIVYGKMYYPKKGWGYSQTKVIYNPLRTECAEHPISKGPGGDARPWDMGYPSSVLINNNELLTVFYDAGCKNILGGTYTTVKDWEVEEQTITFDDAITGESPKEFKTIGGKDAAVSNSQAASGTKSLELRDTSPSLIASASRDTDLTATKNLEFKIFPENIPANQGLTFTFSNGNNPIFHFMISSEGDLGWHNGTSWVKDLAGGGKVSMKQWSNIRVDVYSPTSANVYLNDKYAGTAHNGRSGFATIDKVTFSTGSTAGVGVHFFIDDVSFSALSNNPQKPKINFSIATQTVKENVDSVPVIVTLSEPSSTDITVGYTVGGTATGDGVDHNVPSKGGSLTIPAGSKEFKTAFKVIDDVLPEDNELIIFTLKEATNNAEIGKNNIQTVTIKDNEPMVNFSVASQAVKENVGSVPVIVTLSEPSSANITVKYTVGGTATGNGVDHNVPSKGGLLPIPAGAKEFKTAFKVIDDVLPENDETIIFTLTEVTNAKLGSNKVQTVTIKDNEPMVNFSVASQAVKENVGSVPVIVTLSEPSRANITVKYTVGGTATGDGVDHNVSSKGGLLPIPADTKEFKTAFKIIDDVLPENDETIVFTLTEVTNAKLGTNNVQTVTIKDDVTDRRRITR